jgi:ubiquinone/menaquinone biosynthesis C-methylase UbiE
MSLSVAQWHARFSQQAEWTHALRSYLYAQVGLRGDCHVLEVGCGTGALTHDFDRREHITYLGIDLNFERLAFASARDNAGYYVDGNACSLPFASGSFDFVLSHYLFLWLSEPVKALQEMTRVVRPGGSVLALAEPDYGSRMDAPASLIPLGKAQTQALIQQGANPLAARLLPEFFSKVGLKNIHFGASGFERQVGDLPAGHPLEWQLLEEDLGDTLSQAEMDRYRALDRKSWLEGSRVLWVPTFYAYGTKTLYSEVNNH